MERIEKERLNIPVAAFQFWEQDFNALLNETMDKSVLYKFYLGEEKIQGIVQLLIEMFKTRRIINMLLKYASRECKIKCSGIKKMFKELLVFECEDDFAKAINYLILGSTAYKATAEVIFDGPVNVTIVCTIFKPLLTLPHTRISTEVT